MPNGAAASRRRSDRHRFNLSAATLALGRSSARLRLGRRDRRVDAVGAAPGRRSLWKRLRPQRTRRDVAPADGRGALVAAVLLPRLLRTFCEFELSLGAAFAVTLGRSLASFAVSLLVVASFRSAVAPLPAMFFLPQILSLVVGYQLLKHLARPVRRLAHS